MLWGGETGCNLLVRVPTCSSTHHCHNCRYAEGRHTQVSLPLFQDFVKLATELIITCCHTLNLIHILVLISSMGFGFWVQASNGAKTDEKIITAKI